MLKTNNSYSLWLSTLCARHWARLFTFVIPRPHNNLLM